MSIIPGATMNDHNPPGVYGSAFYLYSQNHPALYAKSDLYDAIKGVSTYTGTSAIVGYAHGADSFAGYFLNSNVSGYGTAISATHGSIITATIGSGIRSMSISGPENDNYGARALSQEGDGIFGWSQGPDDIDRGVVARSDFGYGLYAYTNGSEQFGAYINDPLFVNGGCVGCQPRLIGINSGDIPLQLGDLLSPNGVKTDLDGLISPLLSVVKISSSGDFFGVVSGRLELFQVSPTQENVSPGIHFSPASGLINPGDYLSLIVQGPAQVRINPEMSVYPGDMLYVDNLTINTSGGTPLGMALNIPDENGLVWLMVGLY
jgi:hypothetical protein